MFDHLGRKPPVYGGGRCGGTEKNDFKQWQPSSLQAVVQLYLKLGRWNKSA